MHFVCEFVPTYFLSLIRRNLAKELNDKGFKQLEIAKLIGVSQPVVSQYLKNEKGKFNPLTKNELVDEFVLDISQQIISKKMDNLQLNTSICELCQNWRIHGPLCDLHKQLSDLKLPVDCRICHQSFGSSLSTEKLTVAKELSQAISELISYQSRFSKLIPEIGCQFINATNEVHSNNDIASFPGRLIKVKGIPKLISPYPEFGHSQTISNILMILIQYHNINRSIISLKYSSAILDKIKLDYNVLLTDEGDKDWSTTLKGSKINLKELKMIADSGGRGFESIIYIMGENPHEVKKIVEKIMKD